jgi:hypothetical protein
MEVYALSTELFGTGAAQSDEWRDSKTMSLPILVKFLKVGNSAGFLCVVINQKICKHHERYFHSVISAVRRLADLEYTKGCKYLQMAGRP